MKISHSQTDAFLLCERKWFYSYGMKLQPQGTSLPLIRGSAGHKVLETYYGTILQGATHEFALALAREAFNGLDSTGDDWTSPTNTRNMPLEDILFTFYFPNEPFVRKGWEVLAVEKEFTLQYEEGGVEYEFVFVVDLICRDTQGKIVVIDHKFQTDFLSENEVELQPQIKKYIAALRALGLPADYALYNQLRTRKIKDPTTASTIQQFPFHPNDATILSTFREQVVAAGRIHQLKELTTEQQSRQALRVGNKMVCRSCDFRTLCVEEQRDGNVALVIETEYQPKPDRK